jgi:hypothetical protein
VFAFEEGRARFLALEEVWVVAALAELHVQGAIEALLRRY